MHTVAPRSGDYLRSTLGAIGTVAALLYAAPSQSQGTSPNAAPQRLFSVSPPYFIEHFNTPIRVAPNERLAVIGTPRAFTLIDLATGRPADGQIWPGLDSVFFAVFGPHGDLILLGSRGEATGWFSRGAAGPESVALPTDAQPRWSPDGRLVAFTRSHAADSGLFVGPLGSARPFAIGGAVSAFAWFPDSKTVLISATDTVTGLTSLSRLDVATGRAEAVARNLDAAPFTSSLVVASDGRHAYLPLATGQAPNDADRHRPRNPKRYLRIYEIDLPTGTLRAVAAAPGIGDSYAPEVAGEHLYWVRTSQDVSVVVTPIAGGPTQTVLPDIMVPAWRPDGRQIAAVYAEFRQADWGLNLDVGVVDVDSLGRALGSLQPFITGWGEDFVPAWSPDGRWVAYHSHRSINPTPYYMAPGRTDDIWLRPVGAPPRDTAETRLTDFGWECAWQTWSRDSKRLVFISWEKGSNKPGISHPYVITIDPATGRAIGHGRLPLPEMMTNTPWAAWSPANEDVGVIQSLGGGKEALWVVPASGAPPRKLVDFESTSDLSLAGWAPDGKGLVYSAKTAGTLQLFWVSSEGGQPRQLTHDDGNLLEPTVSPNGRLVAATRIVRHEEIWRVPLSVASSNP